MCTNETEWNPRKERGNDGGGEIGNLISSLQASARDDPKRVFKALLTQPDSLRILKRLTVKLADLDS